MKRGLVALIVILLASNICAFGQAAAPAKPPSAMEQTLMAAEKSYVEAVKKGDAAFLKQTLTDDFSFVAFDGGLYDRREIIDQFSSGGVDLLPYNMKVMTVGDGVGIVTYDVVMRVPASEDQGPPPRYHCFSTVWVKQGEAWKMRFQQMTVAHWGDW
jgi:hypothetical protein